MRGSSWIKVHLRRDIFHYNVSKKGHGQGSNVSEGIHAIIDNAINAILPAPLLPDILEEGFSEDTFNYSDNETLTEDTENDTSIIVDRIDSTSTDSSGIFLKSALRNNTINSDCDQTACIIEPGRNLPGSDSGDLEPRSGINILLKKEELEQKIALEMRTFPSYFLLFPVHIYSLHEVKILSPGRGAWSSRTPTSCTTSPCSSSSASPRPSSSRPP